MRWAVWMMLCCVGAEKLVRTPFGLAHQDCVVSLPHASRIRAGTDDLLLVDHGASTTTLAVPHKCALSTPTRSRQPSKQPAGDSTTVHARRANESNTSCPASSTHDNGWVLNAYYAQPGLGSFAADYVVPANPTDPHALLYYFIGMTNYPTFWANESTGVKNIIQPVLSWGRTDDDNQNGTWSLSQWFCCPKGVVAHTSYAWNFRPGDVIHTSMSLDSLNNTMMLRGWWDPSIPVRSSDPRVNGSTSLTLAVDRSYNHTEIVWLNLDVTLEVYGVRNCASGYPKGGMWMKNLAVRDNSTVAPAPIQPSWVFSRASDLCDGQLEFSRSANSDHSANSGTQDALFMTSTATSPPLLPPGAGIVERFSGDGNASSFGTVRLVGFELDGWNVAGYAKMSFVAGVGLSITSPATPRERYKPRMSEGTLTQLSRRLPPPPGANTSTLQLGLRGLQPGVRAAVMLMEGESASWWWPTRYLLLEASALELEITVVIHTGITNQYENATLYSTQLAEASESIVWYVTQHDDATPAERRWKVEYIIDGSEGPVRRLANLSSTNQTAFLERFASGVHQGCEATLDVVVPQNATITVSDFALHVL